MAAETQQVVAGFSFAAGDFVKMGLIQDADVTILDAGFTNDRPPNYTVDGLFLRAKCVKADGEETEEWWSLGKKAYQDFSPSEDGQFLIKTNDQADGKLSDSSNFGLLMHSIEETKKYPSDKLHRPSIKEVLSGLGCHLQRIKPKRDDQMEKAQGDKENSTLIVTEIHKLPWEKKGAAAGARPAARPAAAAASAGTPAPAAPAAAAAGPADEAQAKAILAEIVSEAGGTVDVKGLRTGTFRKMKGAAPEARNSVIALFLDAAWLAANGFMGLDAKGEPISEGEVTTVTT